MKIAHLKLLKKYKPATFDGPVKNYYEFRGQNGVRLLWTKKDGRFGIHGSQLPL